MNCIQVDQLLNDLMDEVISPDDLRALEAHCDDCPTCRSKLNATRDMLRLFADMAPEADVPLNVQAKWRSAVKAESKKVRAKGLYRWAAGIAAALVVAIGATFMLNMPQSATPLMEAAPMARSVAMIEADGLEASEEAIDTAVSRPVPTLELAMTVEDLNRTCAYMADLISEYEGGMDEQRFDKDGRACANLYIDLPAENAAEFLNAASHFDLGHAEMPDIDASEADRVVMLLVLKEAKP